MYRIPATKLNEKAVNYLTVLIKIGLQPDLGNGTGNPRVSRGLPVPIPVHTHTRGPAG
jgi:hypothetical protein